MNLNEMNSLEFAAYVRLCLHFFSAGCFLLAATLLLSAIKDDRK